MSCLMGLNDSSLEISILALVQRGTSTIMLRMPLFRSAKSGMSWNGETTWPFCSMYTRCSVLDRLDSRGQEITCLSESGHTEGVGSADESRTVFWGKGDEFGRRTTGERTDIRDIVEEERKRS
jgi:hypothetical protein